MDFQCLAADQILFDIFKQHYVTVYGGYLRDVLAGLEPVDIDTFL